MSLDNDASIEPARPESPPPASTYLPDVPVDAIRPSPYNHRKSFAGLAELADSIREKGLINPPTVRPAPLALKQSGKVDSAAYELVAGERRWRAAKLAGLPTIAVILRPLSDVEVLELQLIENVQRADVHPLEEADGYRDLLDHHGYTAEKIAHKTGKSVAYVYSRLKLCGLEPGVREPFLAGRINASVALLIARIPSPALQARALREVLGEADDDDDAPDELRHRRRGPEAMGEDGTITAEPIPMSVREAGLHIQRHYMLRLELATFAPGDADLVPAAGSCTGCVHRTGNQPSLFGDVKGADVCTNPPCYAQKTQAAWEIRAAAARSAGRRVLDAGESAKVFSAHDSRTVSYRAAYVDPKDPVPGDVTGDWGKQHSWERLLGKKGLAAVPCVLAQDGTGAGRELLDRAAAVKVLAAAGKIEGPAKAKKGALSPKDMAKIEKERREKELRRRAIVIFIGEAGRVAGAAAKKEERFWGWIARALLNGTGNEALIEATGADPEIQDMRDLAARAKSAADLRALAVQALAAEIVNCMAWAERESPELEEACKALGLSWRDALLQAAVEPTPPPAAAAAAAKRPAKGGKKGVKGATR